METSNCKKNIITIKITDNGVGMHACSFANNKKSMGGNLSLNRVTYFNKQNGYNGQAIETEFSNPENVMGTTVNIHLAQKKFVQSD